MAEEIAAGETILTFWKEFSVKSSRNGEVIGIEGHCFWIPQMAVDGSVFWPLHGENPGRRDFLKNSTAISPRNRECNR